MVDDAIPVGPQLGRQRVDGFRAIDADDDEADAALDVRDRAPVGQ